MKRLLCPCFSLLLVFTMAVPNPVLAKDAKKNPDDIGNRDVSGKVNFYSLEKEIALGKQLAQEVERQAKSHQRSGDLRVRQPSRPEPGAKLRRQGPVHH